MSLKTPIRSEFAVLAVAAFFVIVPNVSFWRRLYGVVAPDSAFEWLFLGAIAASSLMLLTFFFGLFARPYVLRPVATSFLLTAAAAAYFMNEYGIVIDVGMIRNITHTDTGETYDLLTGKLALHLVAFGVLPAALLWLVPISYRPLRQDLWLKAKFVVLGFPVLALLLFPFTGSAMSLFREQRVILHAFAPFNFMSALAIYGGGRYKLHAHAAKPYGEDAHKAAIWSSRKRKTLTVLVIGETARAQNFSLNGYKRETNPLLSKVPGLITFTEVRSCGTATAQSVPCLFSGQGRAGYERAAGQEGLLHILQRAGFSVLWRENQAGCAGVCRGIPTDVLREAGTRKLFDLGGALDENLIADLDSRIDGMAEDSVIVLHMMGSHGPAYYKRYPAAFERFQPTCKHSQFSRCELAQIVNSYDNTIVYTDYVLAKLIALLAERDSQGTPAAMIYISDHGESLGEGNIYLHGLPYMFAPDVQKHVPMLVWLSPKLQADLSVNTACLERHRHQPLSHDNFFHSVLGLLDVQTKAYDPRLDIFAKCKGPLHPVLFGD
jgi:lipid A ethanolaminephosphotransferase